MNGQTLIPILHKNKALHSFAVKGFRMHRVCYRWKLYLEIYLLVAMLIEYELIYRMITNTYNAALYVLK